jgi:hypothetical protein
MFNTPPCAATSTRPRKPRQIPKPSAFSALIIIGITTAVARGLSAETAFYKFESSNPPSVFDPISLDGTIEEH